MAIGMKLMRRNMFKVMDGRHGVRITIPGIALIASAFTSFAAPCMDGPAQPYVVQNAGGDNSWPMIQAIGEKLVCADSRGWGHSIGEDARAVYARTSANCGKTWTAETVVAVGSDVTFDAGNVGATTIGDRHHLAFYSGKAPDTGILLSVLAAPTRGKVLPHASL